MSQVSRVELYNFRCIRRFTIDADPRPTIIHGANGSGKTSILEALSLCSPGRGLRAAPGGDLCRRGQPKGWRSRITVTGGDFPNLIETFANPGAPRRVRIGGKSARQLDLLKYLRVIWLSPLMDRIWVDGADGRRKFLDRMAMSFSPRHPTHVVRYEKAMRERNRLLRWPEHDAGWVSALEAQMAENGIAVRDGRQAAVEHLQGSLDAGAAILPAAQLDISMPDTTKAATSVSSLKDVFRAGRHRDMQARRALNGPHRADLGVVNTRNRMPARLCSSGEQKELLLAIVLAHARAVFDRFGQRPVLLLDEIAAHLDVGRRSVLLELVRDSPAQVWMTGTGIAAFASVQESSNLIDTTELATGRQP